MTREQKRAKIKELLTKAVEKTNEQMIGIVPADVRQRRNTLAWLMAAAVVVSFALLLRKVFGWIGAGLTKSRGGFGDYRTRLALVLIAPALLLILTWSYYPLLRGSLMAFQDYNVMGGSPWVGINNFADVLFDARFWLSLKNAAVFCALWMVLGFLPPMVLAVMLQEIRFGKIVYRVLFYLPAVVSGVVILFMWRAIYDPSSDGVLNKLLAVFHLPPQT